MKKPKLVTISDLKKMQDLGEARTIFGFESISDQIEGQLTVIREEELIPEQPRPMKGQISIYSLGKPKKNGNRKRIS